MNNLLERAKKFKQPADVRTETTTEELELCLEYLRGTVSARGYAYAIEAKNPQSATHRIPGVLRWALDNKIIEIKQLIKSH